VNIVGKYSNLLEGMRRILELAEKPSKDEYLTMLKVILLGFTVVGLVSFATWLSITALLNALGVPMPR